MISFVVTKETYDEATKKVISEVRELKFEHSLKSISIWEAKYKKPFLVDDPDRTREQVLDYICMMCFNYDITTDDLDNNIISEINDYLKDPHSATVINDTSNDSNSRRIMTSEVLYAYMANGQIPFSCDEWNIYNLLKLIGVLNHLNGPKKEKSQSEIYEENRRLNRERREKFKSKG